MAENLLNRVEIESISTFYKGRPYIANRIPLLLYINSCYTGNFALKFLWNDILSVFKISKQFPKFDATRQIFQF